MDAKELKQFQVSKRAKIELIRSQNKVRRAAIEKAKSRIIADKIKNQAHRPQPRVST